MKPAAVSDEGQVRIPVSVRMSRFAGDYVQQGLDSVIDLLALRRQILERLDPNGGSMIAGVEVLAVGLTRMRRSLRRIGLSANDTLATHPFLNVAEEEGLEFDRNYVLRGGQMRSLYNPDSVPASPMHSVTRAYFSDDVLRNGNFAAPVPQQMLILDRSSVVLEGPQIGGRRSIMAISQPSVVAAALQYWHAQEVVAVPVAVSDGDTPDLAAAFTPRQREIATMLADDLTDRAIAARLQLGLRTVQSEVATIMRLLHVRSRFGAGYALGKIASNNGSRQHAHG